MTDKINYEWKLIKKLYPYKKRKTIEAELVRLYQTQLYKFAAHRDSRLNYQLLIEQKQAVGFIKLK